MIIKKLYTCRVCWFINNDMPWWLDWKTPIYSFCSCCWVEFWYEDSSLVWIKNYRKNWENNWFKFFKIDEKVKDWSYEEQRNNIPLIYR